MIRIEVPCSLSILLLLASTTAVCGGTIDGLVYGDANANALRDDPETTLSGWSVFLDLSGNGEFDEGEPTAVSDPSGAFLFRGLLRGSYQIGVRGLENRGVDTSLRGGDGGSGFRELRNDAIVVGFETWTDSLFLNRDLIVGIQAIYRTPSGTLIRGETYGERRGRNQRILAEDGYAVGGLRLQSGDRVDGFRATFMRVQDDGLLDSKDSYQSDYAGGSGGVPAGIGHTGQPVVGIFGRDGADVDAIGLVMHSNVLFEDGWSTSPFVEVQLSDEFDRVTVATGIAPARVVHPPELFELARTDQGVVLEWSDVSPRNPNIATHTIWRSASADSEFLRVDEGEVEGNSWVDSSTDEATEYCWSVRAVTTAGAESDNSDAMCLSTRAFFRRGFTDGDAQLHVTDAIVILQFLFRAGPLACLESADVNNDDRVDVCDAISLLGFLFLGTLAPPDPFEHCGVDLESGALGCEINGACE